MATKPMTEADHVMIERHAEYNRICEMVATCPFDEVKRAWLYACENGMDTVTEDSMRFFESHKERYDAEVTASLDSLPCALQSAYENDISNAHRDYRAAQRANRALLWWRHRGYTY